MLELTPHTAASYLRERGSIGTRERVEIRELSGGVSNTVLLVHRPDSSGGDFVLKQALPRLKVQQEWLCSIERIWREVEVLEICGHLLASGGRQPPDTNSSSPWTTTVPQILFSDRENYCYAMTAAPSSHKTWKELLLAGEADPQIAAACGTLLGRLHAASWNNKDLGHQFAEKKYFYDLRIDPYYRELIRIHPQLSDLLNHLTSGCDLHPRCLVHGDFSPKNLLISPGQLMLIDFEVGHYGDPTFDLGFLTSHLALKAFAARRNYRSYLNLIDTFGKAYNAEVQTTVETNAPKVVRAAGFNWGTTAIDSEVTLLHALLSRHFFACLLARVDGKSQVTYLAEDLRHEVRQFVLRELKYSPTSDFDTAIASLGNKLQLLFG
ncbi:MAG: phosphotransferase [Pirellulaceae bacterium]